MHTGTQTDNSVVPPTDDPETPLVSIMIPTCNQSAFILDAVESARKQTYANLEIIVSDDASTDDTGEVLSRYQGMPGIALNRNRTNLGRVGNYRHCLNDLAAGEWVLMLDGDDLLYDPEYIAKAIAVISRNPGVDLVFSNIVYFQDSINGTLEKTDSNRNMPPVVEGSEVFLRLATDKFDIFHSTALYRRQKAIKLDFYREDIVSSDWESIHRYILTGKVAHLDLVAAAWRYHGDNASRNRTASQRIDNLKVIFGPYHEALARGVMPKAELDRWLSSRLFQTAHQDIRKILKQRDFHGYRDYMQRLRQVAPDIYRRLRHSPSIFIKRMKCLF